MRNRNIWKLLLTACMAASLTGCGAVQKQQPDIEYISSNTPGAGKRQPKSEENELYSQILLFIRQGMREHRIEGLYTAYFKDMGEEEGRQEILLEGEDKYWEESIAYTFDEEERWYHFSGIYEPVLSGDPFYAVPEPDGDTKDFIDQAVYQASVSASEEIGAPARFDGPPGPVIYDSRREEGHWRDYSSYLIPYLYLYQDERMGMSASIEYPVISFYPARDVEEELNQAVRNSFFYGYGVEAGELEPEHQMYGGIDRTYRITRQDDELLSLRIYENNYFRGANHPNEWETGLTLDLKTGKQVKFSDLLEPDMTVAALLEQGTFHCLWNWRDTQDQKDEDLEREWLSALKDGYGDQKIESLDSYFYLTEDSLGLITSQGRYYTCIEADLEELGIGYHPSGQQ